MKCSIMFGIERAQKVMLLIRRVLISPWLMISAFRCFAISIARVAIRSMLHGTQPSTRIGLVLKICITSRLACFAWSASSKISDRSGRVRPASSTGAFSLLMITPEMLLFLVPPKLEHATSMRSFSCVGLSVPGVATNTISAPRVLAISAFTWLAKGCLRVGTRPSIRVTSASLLIWL
ncbi:Uncharacterised protein [Vibrio cholerae]|nr:Uncharacterised protein [Vibrio cholerae]CRZ63542.1 Uncharacterised protein [Vibrio cholerae]CRZ66136.1 Uncharacterised protein [Vibrio cholerae]CRZ71108.1 Uncharacterised protein [Vibrio cholerae]CSA12887.1 Uncharacterised protein [Vibrio cholerae]